jgi:hypothetical protein
MLILLSCRKIPYTPVSDEMKSWFAFQKGSYWIYKDDSTGDLDSVFITSTRDFIAEVQDYSKTIERCEWVDAYFESKFLTSFTMRKLRCGPNFLFVGSHLAQLPPDMSEGIGNIAYFLDCPLNQNIISDCNNGGVFYFEKIQTDTVNNKPYSNIIFSKCESLDSSSTNTHYYLRKIYFAKDVGIINYEEISRKHNIMRSYSLIRYKTIQ